MANWKSLAEMAKQAGFQGAQAQMDALDPYSAYSYYAPLLGYATTGAVPTWQGKTEYDALMAKYGANANPLVPYFGDVYTGTASMPRDASALGMTLDNLNRLKQLEREKQSYDYINQLQANGGVQSMVAAMPGYQAALDNQRRSTDMALAARGMHNSSAAIGQLARGANDIQSNYYNNLVNSLSSLANTGYGAAQQTGSALGQAYGNQAGVDSYKSSTKMAQQQANKASNMGLINSALGGVFSIGGGFAGSPAGSSALAKLFA